MRVHLSKLSVALYIGMAVALFGLSAFTQAADRNGKKPVQRAEQPGRVAISKGVPKVNAGLKALVSDEQLRPAAPAPPFRSFSPYVTQGAVGSIIRIHTGGREVDQNGTWGRHAWKSASGKVHVVYGSFLGNSAGKDNIYLYNTLYCEPDSAAISHMDFDEFNAPVTPGGTATTGLQNGNIHVSSSGKVVWIGRRGGSIAQVAFEANECAASLDVDTAGGFTEPKIYAASATNWVAIGSSPAAIGAPVHFSTTADGGETWSASAALWPNQWFLGNYDIAGNGMSVYAFQISGAGQVQVKHSTDGGATWGSNTVVADYPAGFRQPDFAPTVPGGCIEVFQDTAHIVWSDERSDLPFPLGGGGAFFHAMVTSSGNVIGPTKIADVGKTAGLRDESITTFGLAHPDYGNVGLARRSTPSGGAPNGVLYMVWSQPPVNTSGPNAGVATDTSNTGYSVRDVWCSASRTNGRSWDAPSNISKTNSPGCDGTTVPCSAEVYVSVAPQADSVLYIISNLDKFPGWQSLAGEHDPAKDTRTTNTWRLYLPPARDPVIVAKAECSADSNLLAVSPGQTSSSIVTLINSGLANLVLDSVRFSGTLNGFGLVTSSNAVLGTPINETQSYDFNVTFNATTVSFSQQGLRYGNMIVHLRGDLPPSGPGFEDTTISCTMPVAVYVVSNFCQNSGVTIHSSTNESRVFSQGAVADQTNPGMFYITTGENMIFDGGVAIVNPANTAGPKGMRHYYSDKFLRCLRDPVLDSIKVPTQSGILGDSAYNIYVKSVGTGLLDSGVIWESIFEQSNDPAKSDFLTQTLKAVNITGATLNDINLGVAYDIDVTGAGANGSFDTTFTATNDGKTYRMLVLYSTGADSCDRSGVFYGAIPLPNGTVSSSPVEARGAVSFNNRRVADNFGNTNPEDTLFVRYMESTGYRVWDNRAESLMTGHYGSGFNASVCPPGSDYFSGEKPRGRDLGYVMSVKKVSLPSNPQVAALASRYGLEGLAASMDTLTFDGPTESFTILHVGGVDGTIESFMEHADSAVSWFNQNAFRQIGGDIFQEFHLSLSPPTATNIVGDSHTVIATLGSGSASVDFGLISFEVTSGPHRGIEGAGVTGSIGAGQASFTYQGTDPGTDQIVATVQFVVGQPAFPKLSSTVLKTWTAPPSDFLQFEPPTPPDGSSFPVEVGDNLGFTIRASNPVRSVILSVTGLPSGAHMTPNLPATGTLVTSSFSWTPSSSAVGSHSATFTATDGFHTPISRSYSINVIPKQPCPTTDEALLAMYVSDFGNHRILKLANLTGSCKAVAFITDSLRNPAQVLVAPNGNILAADISGNQIVEFDPNGVFQRKINPPQLNGPWGMAMRLPDSNIFVTNYYSHEVLEIAYSTGTISRSIGGGQLFNPTGVAFGGPSNNLFVASSNYGAGEVRQFQMPSGTPTGSVITHGSLKGPRVGLTFRPFGNLYASIDNPPMVLQFNPTSGQPVGSPISGGGLSSPRGLGFAPNLNLWVASSGTNSILEFSPSGSYLNSCDENGMSDPTGISFLLTPKGDLDGDKLLTATDVVQELNCVFLGEPPSFSKDDCSCDLNCDGLADATDVVQLLLAVFLGIPFEPCP